MSKQVEQIWLNQEVGLLYKTSSFTYAKGVISCIGKKVVVEVCELDTVLIEGKYYRIIGYMGGLDILESIVDTDGIDDKELGECWDVFHKQIWDVFWEKFTPELINMLADIVTADRYKITVEELNRRLR